MARGGWEGEAMDDSPGGSGGSVCCRRGRESAVGDVAAGQAQKAFIGVFPYGAEGLIFT
jgi:hypothetical protein